MSFGDNLWNVITFGWLKLNASRKQRHKSKALRGLERLEGRELMAADFRSFDGVGNNLANVEWGSTNEDFLRKAAAAYADGNSAAAGANRLSAREISNLLSAQKLDTPPDERGLSAYIYAWGQFLDHDIDLTNTSAAAGKMNIAVPKGDPVFDPNGTGTVTLSFTRSAFNAATGTTNARQQVNSITAFIDGSMVYGSDKATADSLRTFAGGQMKTSAGNLLPMDNGMFAAGDIRANENPELTSMQTLFVREHNRIAANLAGTNPTWTDERLYQEARRVVIGEIQAITYKEFLPALLGKTAIRPYAGYNANVNAGISNEFAAAAFRLGHSMVEDDIEFIGNNGEEVRDPIALKDAFFNPGIVQQTGIDPILKYLASTNSERIDTQIVDGLRNFLFGAPGAGGLDLAALNIQRGRDHGLADYNSVRAAYGLPKVTSFAQITKNVDVQQALQKAYGNVNNIDLWVGGLAEDHVPGTAVGATFQRILADQFTRLRDGDRFWYQRDLQGPMLQQVERTTLADVIRRNSQATNLQDNVFFFRTSIEGRVFNDLNRDGQLNGPEPGIANALVALIAADGTVVATTRTLQDGRYRFEGIDLGKYQVVVNDASGKQLAASQLLELTRGQDIRQVNLALAPPANRPQQPPPPLNPPANRPPRR